MGKAYKITTKVLIPVNENPHNGAYVPQAVEFLDNKRIVEQVGIAINQNIPALLVGETGTGKTSLVRHLAHKTQNAFVRVNHNGGTSIEDIVGRWIINEENKTEWVDGILIEAMKNGYWYLADEINAAGAEINFVYHSLLDDDHRVTLVEKGNEVVIPHPNFRFFGAMNPAGEYAGTKELNKALLSRFAVVKVDFPAPKVEESILVNRGGVPQNIAEKMVEFAVKIRSSHASGGLRFVISTRDLLMWAKSFQIYNRFIVSAETAVINKVGEDDVSAVKDVLALYKGIDDMLIKAEKGEVAGAVTEAVPA